MIKVAIVGGSGYTGLELLRLLAVHESVEVVAVTSRTYNGTSIDRVEPSLKGFYDGLSFSDPEGIEAVDADVYFSCLPHGASMDVVAKLAETGKVVIDLSADFRLKDVSTYEKWYCAHKAKELIEGAVYGLPELYRSQIKAAKLIANPGCYPTGATLAIAPLLKGGLIDTDSIIIDSKSGTSGAGRTAAIETSFVEVTEGFKAYNVGIHRHTPEIEQTFGELSGLKNVEVIFTPHLLPVSRGILSTVYLKLKDKGQITEELLTVYKDFYKSEPFVRILDEGEFPNLKDVKGSNYCDVGLRADGRGGVVVISAIDNLVKGASGQAIQNMNIIFGFNEDEGLISPPIGV